METSAQIVTTMGSIHQTVSRISALVALLLVLQVVVSNDAAAQSSSSGNCSAAGPVGGNFSPNCDNTYAPPQLPTGLYQDGQLVGHVQGATTDKSTGIVTFQNLAIHAGVIDLSQDLEIQGILVRCPDLASMPTGMSETDITIAGQTKCQIEGRAH